MIGREQARWSAALPALVGVVAVLSIGSASAARTRHTPRANAAAITARRLSRRTIPQSAGWHRYDEAPSDVLVHPVRVLHVSGPVANAPALANPASGQTATLTYIPGGPVPSLVLDYGKELGGIATFDVAAGTGTTIKTTYSETLRNLGNDGNATAGAFFAGNVQRSDSFPITGPGPVTAQLVQGGERYERVTLSTPGTVTLRSAGIDFTPPRETPGVMPGHFYSSDDLLNRIWYASVYTLNLNQLTPGTPTDPGGINQLHLILDGAKRDRAVWSGDHLISDLTDFYASDPSYAKESDALFLEHPATSAGELVPVAGSMSQPGPLPGACSPNPAIMNQCISWSATYSMVVMTAVYNYYLYTGDLAFVRDHWPAVIRQMAWDAQQVGADGLFAVTSLDDADWNLASLPGELTYVNAVYVQALASVAKLATAIGDSSDARKWSAAAVTVKSAVNRILWDPKTGVYDGSTTNRGSVVQDANVTAILAGIPAPARSRAITRVLSAKLATRFGPAVVSTPVPAGYSHDISPFMGSFHLLADFAAGNEPAALAMMRQEWGYMISQDPGGVDWERIQPNGVPAAGSIADSMAHAWSTGPAPALSKYVLGVAPATPGYASWTIAPQPGDLRWAQGVVPTPHGQISVAWKRIGARTFLLSVATPRGTSGTVKLPRLGPRGALAEDGHLLRRGRLVLRGIRGHHTFAWTSR